MEKRTVQDLAATLTPLTGDEAFRELRRAVGALDWSDAPAKRITLADGANVRFDRRRRDASIELRSGGLGVVDLGQPDRTRAAADILTPGLVAQPGPDVVLGPTRYSPDRAELGARDPFSTSTSYARTSVPTGSHPSFRMLGDDGQPALVGLGRLEAVQSFYAFSASDGVTYARLRTSTGLACLYDAGKKSYRRLVTDEVVEQARAEGFAALVAKGETVGVLVDLGRPGDFLVLQAFADREHGGTVGLVVDLRRPPVKDGAIVDP